MKIMNGRVRPWRRYFLLVSVLILLAGAVKGPVRAAAPAPDLEINGPGLSGAGLIVSAAQLRGMEPLRLSSGALAEQYDEWYSSVNTWPSRIWYRGRGLRLADLLDAAGGLNDDATMIRFVSGDGFTAIFTVNELLWQPAYRFPRFMDSGLAGHLPTDDSDRVPVEPLLAHHSFAAHTVAEIKNEEKFSETQANHLIFGQRAATHQNNAGFAKYVTRIEVLTDPIPEWDKPTAEPEPGLVAAGTEVRLFGPLNDEDKVHYSTDGTEPTATSPMYNTVASRWWASRNKADLAAINRPIVIFEDTVIRAVVIGPGKANSQVVDFRYQVAATDEPGPALTDIEGHWAELHIRSLAQSGAVSGDPAGAFGPDLSVTRAQYVAMLMRGLSLEGSGMETFSDTKTHWARDYISQAVAYGIVQGYDEQHFGPDDTITREQMAAMAVRALKLNSGRDELPFTDQEQISPWARAAVDAAMEHQLVGGYEDSTFRPLGRATKAEAATVVFNCLQLIAGPSQAPGQIGPVDSSQGEGI